VLSPEKPNSHGKSVRKFNGLLHTGTHVDSAQELRPEGIPVDRLPLDAFFGPALVADMTHKVPGGAIGAEDLEAEAGAELSPGERLLIRTDWSRHYGQPSFEDSPWLTVEAAEWCIAREVSLIGVDFQPVRRGDQASQAKRVFAEHDIPFLSNLFGLDQLRSRRVTLIAFPLRLQDAEAAMARAVIVEED
jgi:arylformamidase